MDAPKCKFCGVKEWRHVCGTNGSGVDKRILGNGRDPARGVREVRSVLVGEVEGRVDLGKDSTKVQEASLSPTKVPEKSSSPKPLDAHQRWSRNAYNAYQKELMKVRRAIASGRAEPWPRA